MKNSPIFFIGHKIQRVTKTFFLFYVCVFLLVYTKYKIFIEMIHTNKHTHTHIRAYIHVNEKKKEQWGGDTKSCKEKKKGTKLRQLKNCF